MTRNNIIHNVRYDRIISILLFLPVGGLLFITADPKDDTAEEADDAVMVGGEGEEEKCAGISGESLFT